MKEPEKKINFHWGESAADNGPERTMFLQMNDG